MLGLQPENLGIAIIGDNDPFAGVEHRQALHHALQGSVEPDILSCQGLLALLEQGIGKLELAKRTIHNLQGQHCEGQVGGHAEQQ